MILELFLVWTGLFSKPRASYQYKDCLKGVLFLRDTTEYLTLFCFSLFLCIKLVPNWDSRGIYIQTEIRAHSYRYLLLSAFL